MDLHPIDSESQQAAAEGRAGLRHAFGGDAQVYRYASAFSDLMEMRAPASVVAGYLDEHQVWFESCASPMEVTALGDRGYVLSLGRFGALQARQMSRCFFGVGSLVNSSHMLDDWTLGARGRL